MNFEVCILPRSWFRPIKDINDSKASRIKSEGNWIQFSFKKEIIDDLENLCTVLSDSSVTTIINEIK